MSENNILNEIHNLNLSYLLFAQRLMNEDMPGAKFRLGIDDAVAAQIKNLTLQQMIKLSETNQFIFKFRLDEKEDITRLTSESRIDDMQQIHTSILLAGKLHKQLTNPESQMLKTGTK